MNNTSITYRNVGDTLTIVQVTEEHVARSSTLDPEDVGTWCFIMKGCLMGFFPTREECQDRVDALMSDGFEPSAKFNPERIY